SLRDAPLRTIRPATNISSLRDAPLRTIRPATNIASPRDAAPVEMIGYEPGIPTGCGTSLKTDGYKQSDMARDGRFQPRRSTEHRVVALPHASHANDRIQPRTSRSRRDHM